MTESALGPQMEVARPRSRRSLRKTREQRLVDRRRRVAVRTARLSALIFAVAACTLITVSGSFAATLLGPVILISAFTGWGAILAASHPFLLLPSRYIGWLRTLPPYQPQSIWQQAAHRLTAWVGACLALVISAVVGADLSTTPAGQDRLALAWEYAGVLLPLGLLFWWSTGSLWQLAAMHRRGIATGALPAQPGGGTSVFWLFATIWMLVLLGALGVIVAIPAIANTLSGPAGL